MEHIQDNLLERQPLSKRERLVLEQAAQIISQATIVRCTGCGYCLEGCPKNICIPNYFRLYNDIGDRYSIKLAFESIIKGQLPFSFLCYRVCCHHIPPFSSRNPCCPPYTLLITGVCGNMDLQCLRYLFQSNCLAESGKGRASRSTRSERMEFIRLCFSVMAET